MVKAGGGLTLSSEVPVVVEVVDVDGVGDVVAVVEGAGADEWFPPPQPPDMAAPSSSGAKPRNRL